jgi:Uma2 family endonuclease
MPARSRASASSSSTGKLLSVTPQRPRHAHVVQLLTRLLHAAYGDTAQVRTQLPLAVSDESEPGPDVAVGEDGIWREHPQYAWLIVEVADTPLALDTGAKARLYAGARIREYWVIDLVAERVLVHREPRGGSYTSIEPVVSGRLRLPRSDASVEVSQLLEW